MTIDARTFRKALGCYPTGVTVVTTASRTGEPVGVTISSFTSLSLSPPLVLFCLDNRNPLLPTYRDSGHFAVNVLAETQREISIRFASREGGRFAGLDYQVWDTGAPILPGCLTSLECRLHDVREGGDHHIFIGEVVRLEYSQAGQPLVYFRGAYADLGIALPLG